MKNRKYLGKHSARRLAVLMVMALLLTAMAAPALGGGIRVLVDGQEIDYGDSPPMVIDDRVMVGVRSLALALGVPEEGITWDGDSQTVTLAKDDKVITLVMGSTSMRVNDQSVSMDIAPANQSGRVYLPARYVSEALAYSASWDGARHQVNIVKCPGSDLPDETQINDCKEHTWFMDVDFEEYNDGTFTHILQIQAMKEGGIDIFGQYTGVISYQMFLDPITDPVTKYIRFKYPEQELTCSVEKFDQGKYDDYSSQYDTGADDDSLAPLVPEGGGMFSYSNVLTGTYEYLIVDPDAGEQSGNEAIYTPVQIIAKIDEYGKMEVQLLADGQAAKFTGKITHSTY